MLAVRSGRHPFPHRRIPSKLGHQCRAAVSTRLAVYEAVLIQEVIAIKRIALDGAEAGVENHSAKLFFRRGAPAACGGNNILLNQNTAEIGRASCRERV